MRKVNIIIIALILLTGCHRNTVKTALPSDADRFEISESIINSHLYGWLQAEILYEKEFNIRPTKEIEEKLRQIRFLILVRQIEEGIPDPKADETIQALCKEDIYDKRLCEIVKWVQNGKKYEELNSSHFIPARNDPVFENYLTLFLFQAVPPFDAFSLLESFETTKQTPLFLYMNPRSIFPMEPADYASIHPHFAEGFIALAEHLFRGNKYRLSREFYNKALELIPNYTKALLGLGDIYYALEDYERAMHHYNMVLRYAPADIAAMYRIGLALHQLGRYDESNSTIDRMLRIDTVQDGRVSGIPAVQYYQGQGYYIKAYNQYLLNDPVGSRKFVDMAKSLLSFSPESYYLSGILFYESLELEAARQDFMSAIDGRNCQVPLHLGFIYEKLDVANKNIVGDKDTSVHRSIPHFLEAAACLDSGVRTLNSTINGFDFSEFEPHEQERMKRNMVRRLTNMRSSSILIAENIIYRIDEYEFLPEKEKHLQYLNGILSRLRNL